MSEHENEPGIPDENLPEDLVPSDDNPLAEGLEPGETVDDLMSGGKTADQDDADDADDAGDAASNTSQDA